MKNKANAAVKGFGKAAKRKGAPMPHPTPPQGVAPPMDSLGPPPQSNYMVQYPPRGPM